MKRLVWIVVAVIVGYCVYYGLSMVLGAKNINVGEVYTKDTTKERVVVVAVGPGDSLAREYIEFGVTLERAGPTYCVIFRPEGGSSKNLRMMAGAYFLNEYGLVKPRRK